MQTYTYYFADGTTSAVEVEDDLYALLTKMDEEEKHANRRERRRHISMEYLVSKSVEPAVTDEYPNTEILGEVQDETLLDALTELTPAQENLVYKIFTEGYSQADLAQIQNVDPTAIRNRLRKIYSKIEKFY